MLKLLKMSLEKDLLVRRLRKETLLEVENRKVEKNCGEKNQGQIFSKGETRVLKLFFFQIGLLLNYASSD